MTSSGGVLLDMLALRDWLRWHEVTWIAVAAHDTEVALVDEGVIWDAEADASRPLGLPAAVVRAARHLRRLRPDAVLSAGTGIAVAYFIAARILGVPSIFVHTQNVVRRPGRAGRICGRLASVEIVQEEALAEAKPGAVHTGMLY